MRDSSVNRGLGTRRQLGTYMLTQVYNLRKLQLMCEVQGEDSLAIDILGIIDILGHEGQRLVDNRPSRYNSQLELPL